MDFATFDAPVDLDGSEWVDDIPGLDGVRLKVRSTQNKLFQVATTSLARRSGKKMRTDEGARAFQIATGKPLAEHILVDWDLTKAEGVTALTIKGKPLPFTKDNALKVLTADDGYGIGAAYRLGVEWAGDRVAENIAERAKEAAGN